MRVLSIQVVLFSRDLISRPDLVANKINERLGNVFDSIPTCLNLPLDAPPEIPVVQWQSNKFPNVLNVSRIRTDFIINPTEENSTLEIIESRYKDTIVRYISAVAEQCPVFRIGIIFKVFEEVDDPCSAISEKYFGGFIRGAQELSFRQNKVSTIKGIKINNIFNVANSVIQAEKSLRGILYTRDINNAVNQSSNEVITQKRIETVLKHSFSFLADSKFGEA